MKKILKLYQQITSDIGHFDGVQHDYKMVKKYFNEEINLEDFMSTMFGNCPPNSCHWCCNDYCCEHECDLYEMDEEGENGIKRCTECWRRCLEQEEETVGLSEENNKYVDLNQLKRLEKIYNNFDGCDDFEEARQEGKLDLIKELIRELENKK